MRTQNNQKKAGTKFSLLLALLFSLALALGMVHGTAFSAQPVLIAAIHSSALRQPFSGGEVSALVKSVAERGAALVYLSLLECGERPEEVPGRISRVLSNIAKTYNIHVLAVMHEKEGDKNFRTSLLVNRAGQVAGAYRQAIITNKGDLSAGDTLPVFTTDFGKIACKIGEDFLSPEIDLAYSLKGAGVIFCYAEIGGSSMSNDCVERIVRGQAGDCGAYYMYLYGGAGTGKQLPGMPAAFAASPDGEICSFTDTAQDITFATIPGEVFAENRDNPILKADIPALLEDQVVEYVPVPPKGKIRAAVIPGSLNFEDLLAALDRAGRETADIACLPEYQWNGYERLAKLRELSAKAARYRMYIALGFSQNHEIILFNREGRAAIEYHPARMHHSLPPERRIKSLPIVETDFGKIGLVAFPDMISPLFMRIMALRDVRLFCLSVPFNKTLSAVDTAVLKSRAAASGAALLVAQNPSISVNARSMIIDADGTITAAALMGKPDCVVGDIQLEHHDKPELLRRALIGRELIDIFTRMQ